MDLTLSLQTRNIFITYDQYILIELNKAMTGTKTKQKISQMIPQVHGMTVSYTVASETAGVECRLSVQKRKES